MQFERILRLDRPVSVTRWEADVGTLTIGDASLQFDGEKHLFISHLLSIERIHSYAYSHDLLQLEYSDGHNIATVYFGAGYRRGADQTIDQLFMILKKLSESGAPPPLEAGEIEKHIQEVRENRTTSNRMAARWMWIGAALFFIGLVVTLVTYSRAASKGGSYIIAWGAVLWGAVIFLRGYTERQRLTAIDLDTALKWAATACQYD